MQKRIVETPPSDRRAGRAWLDLEALARVELTSEDPAHPIEAALLRDGEAGWRAAEPGEQRIRLCFHTPRRIGRIRLRFVETEASRTQEFTLRWSSGGGRGFTDVLRQQYTFSPAGATSEVEELDVELDAVATLELTIDPDQGHGKAYASLAEWRVA
jgi:hypothetical protein